MSVLWIIFKLFFLICTSSVIVSLVSSLNVMFLSHPSFSFLDFFDIFPVVFIFFLFHLCFRFFQAVRVSDSYVTSLNVRVFLHSSFGLLRSFNILPAVLSSFSWSSDGLASFSLSIALLIICINTVFCNPLSWSIRLSLGFTWKEIQIRINKQHTQPLHWSI